MAGSNHATTALLTEHFRYTPLTLLDEIINTVNELVYHAVNHLEKALNSAPTEVLGYEVDESIENLNEEEQQAALEETRQHEVDLGIVQIESLLNSTVDKDFDKFEIYTLRNILAIGHDEDADLARWVCLDHYRHLKFDATQDRHSTPESVQLQRRKLHETVKLNAMLREEQARNKLVIEQLHELTAKSNTASPSQTSLAFLVQRPRRVPLVEEMQHVTEQLPHIRKALAELQSSLSAPSNRAGRSQQEVDSLKRRTYLDSQSVKALNRHGIEPDRSKVTQMLPRGITRDSVQDLEKIAQGLRASTTDSAVD